MSRKFFAIFPFCLCLYCTVFAGESAVPKVDRVKPLADDPSKGAPGVFFYENMEKINDFSEDFQDIGTSGGKFALSEADRFSGSKSIIQTYVPLTQYGATDDPGEAGWVWRMFGDNPYTSNIPADQRHAYNTVIARWYHKFQEGFQPREGKYFPNKMGRMRCFIPGSWSASYSVLFWIDGEDGHLSIERATRAPGVHREWSPNLTANFKFSDPLNIGRWIHFEMRVSLGDGPRSDRIQVWADGVLVGDVANEDLAAGYKEYTLNGMSWDCYWNDGSPVTQSRYYDDLLLSTERIGPVRTSLNPVIVKAPFSGSVEGEIQGGWEAEVAQGVQKPLVVDQVLDGVVTHYKEPEIEYTTVWQGALVSAGLQMTVDTSSGKFAGPQAGRTGLAPNTLHFVRLRQRDSSGAWSAWSAWHSGFATVWADNTPQNEKTLSAGYLEEAAAAVLSPDSTAPEIGEVSNPGRIADTAGPYAISAKVSDQYILSVYLYWRKAGETDYSYVRMTGDNGLFRAEIPGQPAGTQVEYYIRAIDGFDHGSYAPPDYISRPYGFEVLDPLLYDFNRDGRINLLDVVSMLLAGFKHPENPALDYNGDGSYSLSDALGLLTDIVRIRRPS